MVSFKAEINVLHCFDTDLANVFEVAYLINENIPHTYGEVKFSSSCLIN